MSYYPQGRMDICSALARDFIPVTQALVDIADTCPLRNPVISSVILSLVCALPQR